MTRISAILVAALAIAAAPERATAQTQTSDQIAEQWREARRLELTTQRDALGKLIAALDAGATPGAEPVIVPRPSTSEIAPGEEKPNVKKDSDRTKAGQELGNFAGLKFGVGISFTLDSGDNDRVSEASLVNGIVRVDDEDNGRARIMLESHYFFTPDWRMPGLKDAEWGVGPFVSLQPGTDNIIEAIGMGLMFGFRRGSGSESFNLGFGMVVDPNTRILGDGVFADRPLPNGETEVRYKEEMQRGFLILSSFSF